MTQKQISLCGNSWIGLRRLDKFKKIKQQKIGQKKLPSIQPWEIKTSNPRKKGGRQSKYSKIQYAYRECKEKTKSKAEATYEETMAENILELINNNPQIQESQ